MSARAPGAQRQQTRCGKCPQRSRGVFCRLSEKELSSLDKSKTANTYRRGQAVFYEGNAPLGAYCVYSGKVKLYKLGIDGKAQVVRLAGPGELLGHESLLSGRAYAATAETIEDSVLCFLDKNTLLRFMEHSPILALEVARHLSRHLLNAEEKLQEMTQKPASARMALLLLDLNRTCRTLGIPGSRAMRLPRQMLADMIGVTRETAIRILADFKQKRLISSQGQGVTLLSPEGLRGLSEPSA